MTSNILLYFFLFSFLTSYSQNTKGLIDEKNTLIKEIEYTKDLLSQAKTEKENSLYTLNLFQKDIELRKSSHVRLSISDLNGKEIRVITDQFFSQGINSFNWDSKDSRGQNVPAGVYFYQAKANSIIQSKKMLLLK